MKSYKELRDLYIDNNPILDSEEEDFKMWLDSQPDLTQEEIADLTNQQKEDCVERYIEGEFEIKKEEPKKVEISKDEKENIIRTAEYTEKYGLKRDWMRCFSRYSYCNEEPGEMLFHVFLNSLIKKKKITIGCNPKLKLITHLYWIQPSGSGKDQATDFLLKIAEEYQKLDKTYLFRTLEGLDTPETMINHFAKKKTSESKYDFNAQITGVFEKYDLLISKECSYLFRQTQQKEKQGVFDLLLIALEGREVTKQLSSWEGHDTITKPNFCFVGTSRPVSNMKQHIVTSGLQQRGLNYLRDIDTDMRKQMLKEVINNRYLSKADLEQSENEIKLLVERLWSIKKFFMQQEIIINEEKKQLVLFDDFTDKLLDDINNNIQVPEYKRILESFVTRFLDLGMAISFSNAASRLSKTVDTADIQGAITLLQKEYEQLKQWVEETIEEDILLAKKRQSITLFLKQKLKSQREWKTSELVKAITEQFGISRPTAYKRIKDNSTSLNSLLIVDDGKVVHLRR